MPEEKASKSNSLKDVLIDNRFRVIDRLGSGAFGEVYKGVNIFSNAKVAVKVEPIKSVTHSHVFLEHRIYRYINACALTVGIPQSYFAGRIEEHNVFVMDMLGPSLEDLFNICGRKFSVKTVCMIGIQIVQRMQYLHSINYIHRDIKPENFVMGVGRNAHIVYIIDMGLAKRYRDANTLQHIPWEENKSLTGTARYVSINTHRGIQQSRRDDLESVTYLLLYFLRGSLPWQGLKSSHNDPWYSRIRDSKATTSPGQLADGFPSQFAQLVAYARNLEFDELPDYVHCLKLLRDALTSAGETVDYQYDWLTQMNWQVQESQYEGEGSLENAFRDKLTTSKSHLKQTSTNATKCATTLPTCDSGSFLTS